MLQIINIAEIVVAILLIGSILMQNRGAGLSSSFGGDFGGYYSKRGLEKFLMQFTVLLATLFILLAIANLVMANKFS
ncbi:MAG: preprotein translocase subunit SecG [Candidatus Moranbacteria bacterium CG10_big_fil_rev_8_21_14_0_10_35_21]|nr:MAG: preprotein translocase subunit SecG [Candidatus Moranbacteria bacterium CG10_big_fil_rev_8_21_14_0_10_35_21]PJA88450.1 MAG: preprotein translocase subunit SecG [Candidatus Moranbacteria bacterium CG_4_9_14_3_um_filter_36_9]